MSFDNTPVPSPLGPSGQGRWVTVIPCGEIDIATAPALLDMVLAAAGSGPGVVVDFTNVTFVDTAAGYTLRQARSLLLGQGQDLAVRCPPRALTMILDLFGLSDLLEVHDGSTNARYAC